MSRPSDGFTLLELVIGLTIAALALTALFASLSDTTRSTDDARGRDRALLEARNLMNAALAARTLAPAVQEGGGAGLVWRREVRAWPLRGLSDLYLVRVEVRSDTRAPVVFATLVHSPPEGPR